MVPPDECAIHALEVGGREFWNEQCKNNLYKVKTACVCEP